MREIGVHNFTIDYDSYWYSLKLEVKLKQKVNTNMNAAVHLCTAGLKQGHAHGRISSVTNHAVRQAATGCGVYGVESVLPVPTSASARPPRVLSGGEITGDPV